MFVDPGEIGRHRIEYVVDEGREHEKVVTAAIVIYAVARVDDTDVTILCPTAILLVNADGHDQRVIP